ncbi:hypothetical protein ANN_11593 [Periplaneta americana]|uniref:Uncharacterized protein n=1 Tax=Periplaneta americana TaxID=6978 RepID=A0ABQ8T7R4_PERAM|nr:hypothetical protein ANN_11593 [Periplaneta americana]
MSGKEEKVKDEEKEQEKERKEKKKQLYFLVCNENKYAKAFVIYNEIINYTTWYAMKINMERYDDEKFDFCISHLVSYTRSNETFIRGFRNWTDSPFPSLINSGAHLHSSLRYTSKMYYEENEKRVVTLLDTSKMSYEENEK